MLLGFGGVGLLRGDRSRELGEMPHSGGNQDKPFEESIFLLILMRLLHLTCSIISIILICLSVLQAVGVRYASERLDVLG